MMLITLTILLPLMHAGAETECQATQMLTVHSSTLPGPIKELLHQNGYFLWNDRTSMASYYTGYPDVLQQNNVFMAACIAGLENRDFHTCVNATHINGVKGGYNITKEDFLKFHDSCNNDKHINFGDFEEEEEEDDYDKEKSEFEEEHQQLEQAAEGN